MDIEAVMIRGIPAADLADQQAVVSEAAVGGLVEVVADLVALEQLADGNSRKNISMRN